MRCQLREEQWQSEPRGLRLSLSALQFALAPTRTLPPRYESQVETGREAAEVARRIANVWMAFHELEARISVRLDQ